MEKIAGSGRKKGTPNKITGQLREMVLAALDSAGGVEYLTKQALTNPGPFLSLLGKCLPLNVSAIVEHEHKFEGARERLEHLISRQSTEKPDSAGNRTVN